ncbi:TOPRIM nucleotidyl transferase/hydrolase domain-containing protein, partial [Fusobacterium mortiferum]|nr:ATP-dependent endonuclease [Fusobacterium mortiferum]
KIVLGYLSKKLDIYKYDYSILECGSKSLIPQFIKLLNVFKIPYVAVYDKDNHLWRTPEEIENSNQKNRIIENSIKKDIGSCIMFENDIEEEIYQENRERKNYKNKPFYALKTVTNKEFIIPEKLEEKIRFIFK